MTYLNNLLIGLDQLFNVLLNGDPDETLSARAWRTERDGRVFGKVFRPLIDGLLFLDRRGIKGHCQLSYESELLRTQLPSWYRA